MSRLTTKSRSGIAPKNFALSGKRYPIENKGHAEAALSDVSRYGTQSQQQKVRSAVKKKYPGMK
jgi:hypothetical protein